jgi:hypothetical protein
MNHRARFRLSPIAGACLAALVFPTAGPAQDEATLEEFYENTHLVRRMFFDEGLTPLGSFEEARRAKPRDVILFFLGSSRIQAFGGLKAFVEAGGAVMIATSLAPTNDGAKEIADLAGWSIAVPPREYQAAMGRYYQEKPFCPFLDPVKRSETRLGRIFARPGTADAVLDHVAANEPSHLIPTTRPQGARLAYFPDVFSEGRLSSPRVAAVGGQSGQGRFVIVASHRLFVNRMMLADTDNMDFARNCLAFLRERAGGERRTVLFVDRGIVNTHFDVPLMEYDPLEHLPELLAAGVIEFGRWLPKLQANLARAEEHDEFHRGMWHILEAHGVTGHDVMRWLVVSAGALFAVYGLCRIGGPGRYRVDSSAPLLPRVVAKHRAKVPLMDRRQQAMFDTGNLWEAARARARAVLLQAGVPEPGPTGREPRVEARGGWWQRRRTRRRALRLWRLAFDPKPQLVPWAAWDVVGRELDELSAELARGDVRFV